MNNRKHENCKINVNYSGMITLMINDHNDYSGMITLMINDHNDYSGMITLMINDHNDYKWNDNMITNFMQKC